MGTRLAALDVVSFPNTVENFVHLIVFIPFYMMYVLILLWILVIGLDENFYNNTLIYLKQRVGGTNRRRRRYFP